MIQFILGGCGTGKSTELLRRIREDLEHHKDVIVIVPEQFSFDAEKRIYEFLGTKLFNRIKTYSFSTLSQHILADYGSRSQNYASEQEKLLFLYQAVKKCEAEGELKVLYKNSTPDSMLRLQELVTRIRREGITAETLWTAAPALTKTSVQLRDKTLDICKILTAYDSILREYDLCDSLNDLTSAAETADMHEVFRGKHVYLDEFGSFAGDQYQILEVIIKQAESVQIAIRADAPGTMQTDVFRSGTQTYLNLRHIAQDYGIPAEPPFCLEEYRRSAHPDLRLIAEQIFRPAISETAYQNYQNLFKYHEQEDNIHFFAADDPVSEIEYLCAEIYHLLSENPELHCRDIAVAVKDPDTYRLLLIRAFERYALPYDIAARKSVQHTELIQYFLNLTEILSSGTWNTEALLRYLKNEFSGYPPETVAMLEHFCFTWSISRDDWNRPFWGTEAELSARSEPFGGQSIELLRKQLITGLGTLRSACEDTDVRNICRTLYRHLCDKKEQFQKRFPNMDILQEKEFLTLWKMLSETLDTVVRNLGSQALGMKDLHQLFVILFKNSSFSTPPETLDSIRVVETLHEILTVRLNTPKVIFVPGVTDQMFPAEIHQQGIFSEHELQALDALHIRIFHPTAEQYSDELLTINKILAAPSEKLYLTYPAVNAARETVQPSGIVGQIARMRQSFPGSPQMFRRQEEIPLDYYAWTKASAYFHFVRNLKKDSKETASLRAVLEQDSLYATRVKKLSETSVNPPAGTSPEVMRALLGDKLILSPSQIESFYSCPFLYFCTYCLRLYMPEQVQFSAQNAGNFAHYCLERILRECKENGEDFLTLTEDQLREKIIALAEAFRKEHFSASVRKDGRFQLNYEMYVRNILELLLHMQTELRKSKFVAADFEAEVGEGKPIAPLQIPGENIFCQGKIDRVDACDVKDERFLRVVDYKTGTKFLSPEKLADGLDMQMLIYLMALEQHHAYGGTSPAGVLYLPSGQPRKVVYEDREKARSKSEIMHDFYQVKGMLLDNVLPYTETGGEDVKPVTEVKKETLFSVSPEQFRSAERHVIRKITEMAKRLYQGDTAPKPYLYQDKPPCSYCQCADICGCAVTEEDTCTKSDKQKKQDLNTVFESDENGGES